MVSSSRNLSLFEAGPYKVCEGGRKKVGVQKKVIGPSRKARDFGGAWEWGGGCGNVTKLHSRVGLAPYCTLHANEPVLLLMLFGKLSNACVLEAL